MRPIALILALVTVVACERGPTDPKGVISALSPAQQLLMPELTMTFVEVTSDSRCPINAMCIWSGNGAVSVAIQTPFTRHVPMLVTLNTHVEPRSTDFAGVTIRLDSLLPNPTGVPIPQDKYVAYFTAVRH